MALLDSLLNLFPLLRRNPTPRQYARLLTRKLAIHAPGEPVRFDEEGFRLLVGQDGGWIINLHNLYPEYCAATRSERVLQLHRTATIARPAGLPSSFDEARSHLMPALRGRGMVEYLRLMELAKDKDVPSGFLILPFSEDTGLMLVYDGDDMMQSFGPGQLEEWGVSEGEALAAALDNLRDATVERFTQPVRGVHMGSWNDAYDSSRLLLPDLAHRVAGANPLAMVPARGTLLLASSKDTEGVRAMVELARQVADSETRPVSALMYRYQDGRPVACQPDDEQARLALARLGRQYRHGDYAAQKETLDELHEKNGTDLFVASYRVMREEASGLEYSVCSWSRGVDTLLPRTERVALTVMDDAGELQELHFLAWEALHAACADLMEPVPDAFPERYRVTRFPELALVRSLALPRAG